MASEAEPSFVPATEEQRMAPLSAGELGGYPQGFGAPVAMTSSWESGYTNKGTALAQIRPDRVFKLGFYDRLHMRNGLE